MSGRRAPGGGTTAPLRSDATQGVASPGAAAGAGPATAGRRTVQARRRNTPEDGRVRYAWYESPIGRLVVAKDDVAVRHVTIPDRDPSQPDSPRPGAAKPLDPEPEPGWSRDDAGLAREVAELEAYFAGELREFEMAVEPAGTAFQRRVWAALARIPYGETWSYGELARWAGLSRGASRAVGAANGANPVAVVLPCHRVIGANGRLVGYGGGLDRKARLLAHERGEPVFAAWGHRAS